MSYMEAAHLVASTVHATPLLNACRNAVLEAGGTEEAKKERKEEREEKLHSKIIDIAKLFIIIFLLYMSLWSSKQNKSTALLCIDYCNTTFRMYACL